MVSESSREPGTRDASQPHLLLGSSSSVCMGKQTSDIHDREGSEIARIAYASGEQAMRSVTSIHSDF
jgi:hypothetical protein